MFDYTKLPDGTMDYEEIRRCYIEFLFDYQSISAMQRRDAFDQLYEIATRGSLELLEETIINKISEFLLANIDYEDFENMDDITALVPNIGLKRVWKTILEAKNKIKNIEVVKEIEECDAEYGAEVEDPHFKYREWINQKLIKEQNGRDTNVDYRELPSRVMAYQDIRRCYIEFLFDHSEIFLNSLDKKMYALEQLWEIASRSSLELLEEEIIIPISDFLIRNIDYEDYEMMKLITRIVPSVGLKKVWETILSKKMAINNMRVVKLIEDCDAEFGEHVEDPHWKIREQVNREKERQNKKRKRGILKWFEKR